MEEVYWYKLILSSGCRFEPGEPVSEGNIPGRHTVMIQVGDTDAIALEIPRNIYMELLQLPAITGKGQMN